MPIVEARVAIVGVSAATLGLLLRMCCEVVLACRLLLVVLLLVMLKFIAPRPGIHRTSCAIVLIHMRLLRTVVLRLLMVEARLPSAGPSPVRVAR